MVSLTKSKWRPGAWLLERHAYAPELNQAQVMSPVAGVWDCVRLPGVTDIETAERQLRAKGYKLA